MPALGFSAPTFSSCVENQAEEQHRQTYDNYHNASGVPLNKA